MLYLGVISFSLCFQWEAHCLKPNLGGATERWGCWCCWVRQSNLFAEFLWVPKQLVHFLHHMPAWFGFHLNWEKLPAQQSDCGHVHLFTWLPYLRAMLAKDPKAKCMKQQATFCSSLHSVGWKRKGMEQDKKRYGSKESGGIRCWTTDFNGLVYINSSAGYLHTAYKWMNNIRLIHGTIGARSFNNLQWLWIVLTHSASYYHYYYTDM